MHPNFEAKFRQIRYSSRIPYRAQIHSVIDFLLFTCSGISYLSVPIGIFCGQPSSYFAKHQMLKVNEVTERWLQNEEKAQASHLNLSNYTR